MDALLFRHLRKAKNSSIVATRERIPAAVIVMPAHTSLLKRVLPKKQAERQFVETALHQTQVTYISTTWA